MDGLERTYSDDQSTIGFIQAMRDSLGFHGFQYKSQSWNGSIFLKESLAAMPES